MPSSPSRPCRAMNATSGAASRRAGATRSAPTSIAITSWPRRSSASSTRAPDFSETWRSSERPPFSTATAHGRRLIRRACGGSRSTLASSSPRSAGRRPAPRRRRQPARACRPPGGAGQRAVQRDLLADDLADPPDALADLVLADAGEVQPHRRRRRARRRTRRGPGTNATCSSQRARQQVGGVDVVGQRRPDEQAALRVGPLRLAREMLGERSRASRRAGGGRSRSASARSPPTARSRSRRRRSTARSTRSRGRRPACRCSSSPAPAPERPSSRAARRARGSWRRCWRR